MADEPLIPSELSRRINAAAGVRVEHNASFGTATVPRVAVALYARQGGDAIGATRISANAGRGIKEPTILQSFSPNPFFLGNPDLQLAPKGSHDFGSVVIGAADGAYVFTIANAVGQ